MFWVMPLGRAARFAALSYEFSGSKDLPASNGSKPLLAATWNGRPRPGVRPRERGRGPPPLRPEWCHPYYGRVHPIRPARIAAVSRCVREGVCTGTDAVPGRG